MSTTAYRTILLLLGLAFIAVVIGAVLLMPQGSPARLDDAIETIAPGDGDLVFGDARVTVDMDPAYRAQFVIDDVAIPNDQVVWTEPTGLHVFEPGPGKAIEGWTPGFHVVVISWDRTTGLPDPGSTRWSFRVQ